jgi:long-subunit acyl-CoA synthetase (AMP-forming)
MQKMTIEIPATINLANGQSIPNYFKAFVNYMNTLCKIHADKPLAHYFINSSFESLKYCQADRIATNLACKWDKDTKITEVVSYLGDHNIDYLITMMALLKLRVTMMAISPRNSEAAAINLLEKTQSKLLIANTKYESLARAAAAKISGVQVLVVDNLDIPNLVKEPLSPAHESLLDYTFSEEDLTKSALIIHRYRKEKKNMP